MSDDTIQRYEKMLAEDPRSRAFAPLAEAHRKAGRLDEAIEVARAGLEVHPGYSGGLVVLGRALYEKGELDNAAEILQKAVTETPESYLGQKFLGKVLQDKGENQGALKALEAANMLSPEDDEVTRLLEEVKSKATPPPTMDYMEEEDGSLTEKAQIVTYEQKPTTIDGVELPPLPTRDIEETFSFSGGETDDPADITPVDVKEPSPPAAEIYAPTAEEAVGQDMTATVIEEEEIEQAMEIESLDELGPEAAAFIMEGEAAAADSEDALPEEAPPAAGQFEKPEAIKPAWVPSSPAGVTAPEAAPEMAASPEQPPPGQIPEAAREARPEPAPAPEPAPVQERVQSPEPIQEIEVRPAEAATGRPPEPAPPEAGGSQFSVPGQGAGPERDFSTETLADLYAQQGLTDKAVGIYRKILEQEPGNEAVRLKLNALKPEATFESGPLPPEVQKRASAPEARPAPSDENREVLKTLEILLENAERMKRS
ncbi:MAG: tetratricopeptide repeat protein [bacterium]|nr:MAG: tetratricopeptide repeat protein [bacterium]